MDNTTSNIFCKVCTENDTGFPVHWTRSLESGTPLRVHQALYIRDETARKFPNKIQVLGPVLCFLFSDTIYVCILGSEVKRLRFEKRRSIIHYVSKKTYVGDVKNSYNNNLSISCTLWNMLEKEWTAVPVYFGLSHRMSSVPHALNRKFPFHEGWNPPLTTYPRGLASIKHILGFFRPFLASVLYFPYFTVLVCLMLAFVGIKSFPSRRHVWDGPELVLTTSALGSFLAKRPVSLREVRGVGSGVLSATSNTRCETLQSDKRVCTAGTI